MLTIEQFYSEWASLYETHSTKSAKERNEAMRAWCLYKLSESSITTGEPTLGPGVFEKIEAWYRLLSEQ